MKMKTDLFRRICASSQIVLQNPFGKHTNISFLCGQPHTSLQFGKPSQQPASVARRDFFARRMFPVKSITELFTLSPKQTHKWQWHLKFIKETPAVMLFRSMAGDCLYRVGCGPPSQLRETNTDSAERIFRTVMAVERNPTRPNSTRLRTCCQQSLIKCVFFCLKGLTWN